MSCTSPCFKVNEWNWEVSPQFLYSFSTNTGIPGIQQVMQRPEEKRTAVEPYIPYFGNDIRLDWDEESGMGKWPSLNTTCCSSGISSTTEAAPIQKPPFGYCCNYDPWELLIFANLKEECFQLFSWEEIELVLCVLFTHCYSWPPGIRLLQRSSQCSRPVEGYFTHLLQSCISQQVNQLNQKLYPEIS